MFFYVIALGSKYHLKRQTYTIHMIYLSVLYTTFYNLSVWIFHQILDNDPLDKLSPSQYKDCLSRYRDFHYEEKTDVRPSYLYNGHSYTAKTTSLFWDPPPPLDNKNNVAVYLFFKPNDVFERCDCICIQYIWHNVEWFYCDLFWTVLLRFLITATS